MLQLQNCGFTLLTFSVFFNIHFWNLKYNSLNIYILRMNDTRLIYRITCISVHDILEHICNPIEYNSDWYIVLSMSTAETSWHIFLSIENLYLFNIQTVGTLTYVSLWPKNYWGASKNKQYIH